MDSLPMRKVHVVDGDPAVRDSLSTLLDLNGFKVESYSTAGAFLAQVNQCNPSADGRGRCNGDAMAGDDDPPITQWVVCEADLPDGSGIDLFTRVRAVSAATPFILLVSRRNPSIFRSARDAGIEQIFQKPLVYRNLLSCINGRTH